MPHERFVVLRKAGLELWRELERLREAHQLTPSELFYILSNEVKDLAGSCVRSEQERKNKT